MADDLATDERPEDIEGAPEVRDQDDTLLMGGSVRGRAFHETEFEQPKPEPEKTEDSWWGALAFVAVVVAAMLVLLKMASC